MICKSYLSKRGFLILFLVFFTGCKNDDREIQVDNSKIDSLSLELSRQEQLNDSLLSLRETAQNSIDHTVYFGKEFENINDPEEHIIEALKQQEDLIPIKAVLGGTMEFREVQVITEDWVLAVYDDGHVQGKSIYEYALQDNGEVKFIEITSKLPK
ncbi:hypothetical protein [Salinimicrobium terrae]|uniref:hypothetical protein n=1 Tax=Salinimicrobium terrae TaxID=470866 RepID=UPI00041FA873|nr:hypothetical protein [Salinimicrobium terrae]